MISTLLHFRPWIGIYCYNQSLTIQVFLISVFYKSSKSRSNAYFIKPVRQVKIKSSIRSTYWTFAVRILISDQKTKLIKHKWARKIITYDHLNTLTYPCRKAECLPVYYQSPTLVGTPNSKPNRLENCHVFSKWSLQRTIKLIHLNKTEHL